MLPLLLTVLLASATVALPDDETVRVRVLDREAASGVTLTAIDGSLDLRMDGRELATLAPGGQAVIEGGRGEIVVRIHGTTHRGLSLRTTPREGAVTRLSAGRTTRSYRGRIDVAAEASRLRLVNVVSLEDYVASVIPAEYPFREIEGVKAQAVLVRTYALHARGRYGTHDLEDHETSQVYRGVETETALARRAAELTRGEILTYHGAPIEAVYFSSSGGHTANNESVWDGRPLPYLRGTPDPYDHASPHFRWTESVDRGRLLRALSRAYGFEVTGFTVAGTSHEGRVTAIRLLGARERTEQANRFRQTVNAAFGRQVLKSTFFSVERRGDRYVFTGRGFGHGVGMSQFGARQQALDGRRYDEILAFYYSGVTLERRSSFDDLPVMLADAPPSSERIEPRPPRTASSTVSQPQRSRVGW